MSRWLAALFVLAVACTTTTSDTQVPATPTSATPSPSGSPAEPPEPSPSGTVEPSAPVGDATAFVDVGGFELAITCEGTGTPTILLEAGLGSDSSTWASIQDALAAQTRTCSYDRAGLGESDPRPGGGTVSGKTVVQELQGLLSGAGEAGPFVLVGHSYGGMLARLYAAAHPDQVVGVVLEDAAHEDSVCDAVAQRVEDDCTVWDDGPTEVDMIATAEALARAGDLDDLPVVVLSHGLPAEPPLAERLWQGYQAALAGLSSDAIHVAASESGHVIHEDQPELIVAASLEVARAAREDVPLGRCEQLFGALGGECV